jgi:D-cysteine desulfhydrase family pyridoxal phosphate-dependent enzyme
MNIPRVKLAHLPTRIEFLPRVTAALGGPKIYCKRDDQTGLGFGGNKTRKLEFLLAEAEAVNARSLVSVGAIQSNHCRQVAALAAKFGYGCILVLSGDEPELATGNLLLDQLFRAEIVWATRENRLQVLDETIRQAQENGRKPYKIPYGGSSATGMMGYVGAMRELAAETDKFDWIVTASSSGGTQAGMVLGALTTGFAGKILGICIEGSAQELAETVMSLVREGATLIGEKIDISSEILLVNDHYIGGGYGVMDKPEIEAIKLFASYEGLLLDPVYTGRAAAGMIDLVRNGFFRKEDKVLFWHTGGTPALFAEPYLSLLQQ